MKKFFGIALWFLSVSVQAQEEDLMKLLNAVEGPAPKEYVSATFKGSRVVNLQTNELPARGVGQLIISHRFGTINKEPLYNFFGLDVAQMRVEYSYSPTGWFNYGWGRSSANKTYDAFTKVRLFRQGHGGGSPVGIVWYSSSNINTTKYSDGIDHYFSDRLSYAHELIFVRKFNETFSMEVVPSLVHFNLVETPDVPNDQWGVGVAARYKLGNRTALTAEYLARAYRPEAFYDPLSIGMDVETGGHVFQLHVSNARFMNDPSWMMQTPGSWVKGDLYFGFNLSRVFTHKAPKKAQAPELL